MIDAGLLSIAVSVGSVTNAMAYCIVNAARHVGPGAFAFRGVMFSVAPEMSCQETAEGERQEKVAAKVGI